MDPSSVGTNGGVKKLEDTESPDSKRDVKVKTLNRVPRACNACRKQKMRCEGADNPPCKRCRNAGLDCLFEKPSREATLTGEAGLERIRSLENHVAEIRTSQSQIQNALAEIVGHIRGGGTLARSSSQYPQPYDDRSPSLTSMGSPPLSAPAIGGPGMDMSHNMHPPTNVHANNMGPSRASLPPVATGRGSISHSNMGQGPPSTTQYHPPQLPPSYNNYASPTQMYSTSGNSQGPMLPPFSSIQSGATSSNVRYNRDAHGVSSGSGSKRTAPPSSNVTSASNSDMEYDDDNGELPDSGLTAPWEVLRNLANVAIQREAKDNGDSNSEPQSRARTPSPERQSRPMKRRKTRHRVRGGVYQDVVTKQIISEKEAKDLFRIFFHGCSTFLPVFDANTDTYEALHDRSPFAVNCICMVAARVRDGGGKASETYKKVLEEVHEISRASLFTPVTRPEAVQAMILVSGWSDNGWLSGGHAVRMAMELSMHKAWPTLLHFMQRNQRHPKEQELIIASRTWFCLYLFEHQLSYGTGRPAILKDDESIWECRRLLQHPLAIEDDMRLVSTVELMAIRERVQNNISLEGPVDAKAFQFLANADQEFQNWYVTWDNAFSQKYEDAAFYRQSLQIQHLHAELFHNASALRDINHPDDVSRSPPAQRNLALKSIRIAQQVLDITINSPAYKEGMKYAVHYTHATATFCASLLLRLARLFPTECNMHDIRMHVERLANLMAEIPGKRYALTLQLMLKRAKKRKAASTSRSPKMAREPAHHRSLSLTAEHPSSVMPVNHQMQGEAFSPTYDAPFSSPETPMQTHHVPHMGPHMPNPHVQQHATDAVNVDNIWRGFEATSNEQLPVWLSDQTLGGSQFTQHGMDAFLLPNDYMPPAPQIW